MEEVAHTAGKESSLTEVEADSCSSYTILDMEAAEVIVEMLDEGFPEATNVEVAASCLRVCGYLNA